MRGDVSVNLVISHTVGVSDRYSIACSISGSLPGRRADGDQMMLIRSSGVVKEQGNNYVVPSRHLTFFEVVAGQTKFFNLHLPVDDGTDTL